MSPFARIGRLLAHPDPRAAACNRIALVVAWNQPFYPLYVWWLVGGDAWAACWTFLSTPLFVAVPFAARRHALVGRLLLVAAGVANTLLSAKAFGPASGVALFLWPCALIAVLAFRPGERTIQALAIVGVALAGLLLRCDLGQPFGVFSLADYTRFHSLNTWSVATLCLLIAWTLGSAARADQTRAATQ